MGHDEVAHRNAEPADPGHDEAALDSLGRLLEGRYSCRAYRPEGVPRDIMARLLALAQRSASWCNAQPWAVIVTEGTGTTLFREALYAHAVANPAPSAPDLPFPAAYEGVYGERRREAGWALYESLGITKGDRAATGRQMMENFRLFGAPHALILTGEAALGPYGILDCGIFLGNLISLMEAAGIGSIAQGALAKFAPFLRQYFGIPAHRQVLCGLSFGYPDPAHPVNRYRTPRAGEDEAVQWVSK